MRHAKVPIEPAPAAPATPLPYETPVPRHHRPRVRWDTRLVAAFSILLGLGLLYVTHDHVTVALLFLTNPGAVPVVTLPPTNGPFPLVLASAIPPPWRWLTSLLLALTEALHFALLASAGLATFLNPRLARRLYITFASLGAALILAAPIVDHRTFAIAAPILLFYLAVLFICMAPAVRLRCELMCPH